MAQRGIISIVPDEGQYNRAKALLSPKDFQHAIYVAVREAAKGGAKLVKDIIKENTTIKPGYLNNQHGRHPLVQSGVSNDDPQHPVGLVIVNHFRVPLIAYQVNVSKGAGVAALVSRSRGSLWLKHAFKAKVASAAQATQGSGHMGIFTRADHLSTKGANAGHGKLTPRGYAGRFAIQEAFGPAVTDLISLPEAERAMVEGLGQRLEKQIASQIDRFHSGAKAA